MDLDDVVGLHGAYRRCELIKKCGRHQVKEAVRHGTLRPLWRGVLIEPARTLDHRTRAAAALLAHGPRSAIASHTAALLHGCTAAESGRTHVLVPYGLCSRTRLDLVVHFGSVHRCDVEELEGLRVLVLDRVVCDLLCTARPRDALAVADQALAQLPERERARLRKQVQDRLVRRPDPRGTRRGAALLDLATGRAESPAESWIRLMVVELGFPIPEVNWWVRSPEGLGLYRVDLAWPEARIALEYDGYAAHAGRSAADEARADDLRRRGWIVIRVTAEDLRDPSRLEDLLQAAFRARGYCF